MRILPDQPSFEFLRREAKDLLAAMRESDPTVALSTAQRELAMQYGFATWSALRDDVQRRRASLPVMPDSLAQELATRFGLGSHVAPPHPLAFEPMGRTWRLRTTGGEWIARPQYHWMNDEQAERGEHLRTAASRMGVASPTPRRTLAGGLVARIEDTPWRIEEWVDVGPLTTRPVAAATAGAIGSLLATLHRLAIPSSVPFHAYTSTRRSMASWQELLERGAAAGKEWVGDLRSLLPAIDELRSVPEPSLADPILGNCLLNEDTVRLGRGRDLVITEWGFAGSVTPPLEFASVLSHLVLRPRVNLPAAASFARGYRDVAGLVPELDRSSFHFEIGGWCNWTWNQLCESIAPRDADRAWLAEHEGRDALHHPMTVEALDRLLEAVATGHLGAVP